MSTVDNPRIDTETRDRRWRRRRHRPSVAGSSDQGTEESLCFSDSDDQSWHSPFGSTAGGSYDEECKFSGVSVTEIEGVSDPDRNSLLSDCVSDVGLESGALKVKVRLAKVEKDCRICKMSWVSCNQESGIPIELGCSCKEDLAAAHKQCAETWFKIKGNTTCEICGATALNVACEQVNEANNATAAAAAAATAAVAAPATVSETRSFWHGRRIMNFLLACMVFAFVISWLFHFNVLS